MIARNRSRRGAVATEFVFLLPIFLLIIFGIIEMGRAVMVKQMLTNAAREGARYAIIPERTDAQVNTKLRDYLIASFPEKTPEEIDAQFTYGVSPSLATATSGEELSVFVQVPFNEVLWVQFFFPDSATAGSVVKMRKE